MIEPHLSEAGSPPPKARPSSANLRQRYCQLHNLPLGQFEQHLLKQSLGPGRAFLLFGLMRIGLNWISNELEMLERIGRSFSMADIAVELDHFHGTSHTLSRWRTAKRYLCLRPSGRRLLAVLKPVFSAPAPPAAHRLEEQR